MPKDETDPVAEALAAVLPDLSHPSGQRVWLAGLAGDKLRRTRTTVAEAIVGWLRKRSTEQERCILCGTGTGEVAGANARAADAWQQADAATNDLRTAEKRLKALESQLPAESSS
jgi:16S rRNA G966 N2-methylase RsmD